MTRSSRRSLRDVTCAKLRPHDPSNGPGQGLQPSNSMIKPCGIADEAASGEFVQQVLNGTKISFGASAPLPLVGSSTANATVECASCHNPHDNSLGNFLRRANAGSASCLSCHIK